MTKPAAKPESSPFPAPRILGVPFHICGAGELLEYLAAPPPGRARAVSLPDTAAIVRSCKDKDLAAVFAASDIVLPAAWPAHRILLKKGYRLEERWSGERLMELVLRDARFEKLRHALAGGSDDARARLRRHYPSVRWTKEHHLQFTSMKQEDYDAVAWHINRDQTDFLWVSSDGEQEDIFIRKLKPLIKKGTLIGAGNAFEWLGGMRLRPPSWLENTWGRDFLRFCAEPGRVWKRAIAPLAWFYCRRLAR